MTTDEQEAPVKFYEFPQRDNDFDYDINDDLAEFVYIQAPDAVAANEKAQAIGIDFVRGSCPRCGPRWYLVDELGGYDDFDAGLILKYSNSGSLTIHYADGSKESYRNGALL